jgi:hypothetical protein
MPPPAAARTDRAADVTASPRTAQPSALTKAVVTATLFSPAVRIATWTTGDGTKARAAVWHDTEAHDQA